MNAVPTLEIRAAVRGETVVVTLRGRLDTPYETALSRHIERLISEGYVRIVIDCAGIDFLSSRGVSAFIGVLDDLRSRGGDLKLIGISTQGGVVLDRLGVSRLIQRFAYLDAALQAFATPIEEYLAPTGLDVFVAAPEASIFHASGCAAALRIRKKVTYPSKNLARKAGLRPCRRCC